MRHNLYVLGSHENILQRIVEKVQTRAEIHLSTKVGGIESTHNERKDPMVLVRTDNGNFQFDEVVVTVPLGCLKRGKPTFCPPMPPRLDRAIQNASYSSLEKVYILFPTDFWSASPLASQTSPTFTHFLNPQYVPERRNLGPWSLFPSLPEPFSAVKLSLRSCSIYMAHVRRMLHLSLKLSRQLALHISMH